MGWGSLKPLAGRGFVREWRRFEGDEGGTAAVFIALAAMVLAGTAGLAFDTGRSYLIQARLSQAVDAAALAGGRSLSGGVEGDFAAQITKYFQANMPDGFMGAEVAEPTVTLSADGNRIEVVASATIPTTIMQIAHFEEMTVTARAVVNRETKGLELALVLDNSSSMSGSKMLALEDSANKLVDTLFGEEESLATLYVSVVPFSGRVNLAGHPDIHPPSPPLGGYVCHNMRPEPYARDDASPLDSAFDHYDGTYEPSGWIGKWLYRQYICPVTSVLGPSQSKSAVQQLLGDMEAKDCTRYDLATAWGWRTLSPDWQGYWGDEDLPLAYDEAQMNKAIVIMTDGENTPDCTDDSESREQTEAAFAETCTAMKTAGIIIYTITYDLDDEATNDLFRDCASGEARYFKSPTGEELEDAFEEIGSDLSTLRLAQ